MLFCIALSTLFFDYCTVSQLCVLPSTGLFFINIHLAHIQLYTDRRKTWMSEDVLHTADYYNLRNAFQQENMLNGSECTRLLLTAESTMKLAIQ